MPPSIVINHYPFNEQTKSYLADFDVAFRRKFRRNNLYFLNGQSPAPRIHNNDMILVVIDQAWLDVIGRQRIPPANDGVRHITATALNSRSLVIPILIGPVDMPSEQQLPGELKRLAHLIPFHFGQTKRQADFAVASFGFLQNVAFVKDLLASVGGGCLGKVDRVFLKELQNRLMDFPIGKLKDRLSTSDKREMRELLKAMQRRKPRSSQDYARRTALAAIWAFEANQAGQNLAAITQKVRIRVCLKGKRLQQLFDAMNQLTSAYDALINEVKSIYPGPPPGAIIPKPHFNPLPAILRMITALFVCSVITMAAVALSDDEGIRSIFGSNPTEPTSFGGSTPFRPRPVECEPACDEIRWFGFYEVGRGDDLESIAEEVGEDPSLIAEVNCLPDFEVSPGQSLCVPEIEFIPEPNTPTPTIDAFIDLTVDFEEPHWEDCFFDEEAGGLLCPMIVIIDNTGNIPSTEPFRIVVGSANENFFTEQFIRGEVIDPFVPLVLDNFFIASESGDGCFEDGECVLFAIVDSEDMIPERNEQNNVREHFYEGAIID